MKKWIVSLGVVLILTVLCIYIFIPANIVISRIMTAEVTIGGEFRQLDQEAKWEKWWLDSDGKPHVKGEPFRYNGAVYRLIGRENNIVGIEISQDGLVLKSLLHLVSFKMDSTGSVWTCQIPSGRNPINRVRNYRKALAVSNNMHAILQNLKVFVSNPQNVYQFSIFKTSTKDTTMLSARYISKTYPTTNEIYEYLKVVEKSIQKQHGRISGYPMLNTRTLDSGRFETQVAIPTNRWLDNDGEVFSRRMVPGNFLCAIVKGGPAAIRNATDQLNNFLHDNNKDQIAKPFEQLVTNRITEPDTSKWITRVYLPVIQ